MGDFGVKYRFMFRGVPEMEIVGSGVDYEQALQNALEVWRQRAKDGLICKKGVVTRPKLFGAIRLGDTRAKRKR